MTETVGQAARRLTRDWASQFPELSIWRRRWLVRRVGPLLQGVILDRSSNPTIYSPTSHAHVLAWPSGDIVFALGRRLTNPSHVEVRFHDRKFAEAAAGVKKQSPLPLDRVPTLSEVLDAFRAEVLSYGPAYPAPGINEIEWMVLLAGAAGDTATVQSCLDFAQAHSSGWDRDSLARMGREQDWLNQLAHRARDQEELLRVVESEVERHKLTNVNTVDMPADAA